MKPRIRIAAAFLAFAVAGGRVQAQTAKAPTSTQTPTTRLDADLENSRVYIKVTSGSRFGHDHGVVGQLESGWVKPGSGGKLVFAMKTFITDTPDARRHVGLRAPIKPSDQKKSTSNLLGPDVLDVQRHPRATFEISTFDPVEGQEAGSPGLYQLGGTFTLHGVSRPLALRARLEPTTELAVSRLQGSFAIRQTHFGITPYSALGGMVSIEDKLDIWGEFVLHRPDAQADASAPRVTR
jgi:YceI-like domain